MKITQFEYFFDDIVSMYIQATSDGFCGSNDLRPNFNQNQISNEIIFVEILIYVIFYKMTFFDVVKEWISLMKFVDIYVKQYKSILVVCKKVKWGPLCILIKFYFYYWLKILYRFFSCLRSIP